MRTYCHSSHITSMNTIWPVLSPKDCQYEIISHQRRVSSWIDLASFKNGFSLKSLLYSLSFLTWSLDLLHYFLSTSTYLFFLVNWLQTVILIYLLYAIRNVKDELNLKTELIYVIIIWVIFSLSYFTTLVASNINKADDGHESAKAIFSFIQIRNFFSFFVQTLYCYFTIKSSPGIRSNQDYMSSLHDFEVAILGTVLPYLYFKKYVCED